MKTERTRQPNDGPKLPEKPQYRNLGGTAKAIKMIPYYIEGDPELGVSHEDNFVVLLGPLKYRSYANYENMFQESLDTSVSRMLWIIQKSYQIAEASALLDLGKDVPEIKDLIREESGRYTFPIDHLDRIVTPFGLLHGSLDRNAVDLVAFILSQHGRVRAAYGDGTYDLDPVTMDDIIDHLDPQAINKVAEEDGQQLLFEILEVSGVWQPEKVAKDLKENDEVKEDELKNSLPASTVRKSSRSKKPVEEEVQQ